MPAILRPAEYDRRLSAEPDVKELLAPFPIELMIMWPISTRVNKPENDEGQLLETIVLEGEVR